MGKAKIHFFNRKENDKVPYWEENKVNGYKMSLCGYQRKYTTKEIDEVTCKLCLKEYFKKA